MRPSRSIGPAEGLIEGGVARGDALHAAGRLTMTIGAGLSRRPVLTLPQYLTVQHPEHARISAVVVLHPAQLGTHQPVIRTPLVAGDLARLGAERNRKDHRRSARPSPQRAGHSTVMAAFSLAAKPLSPRHSKAIVPLSVATVKNEMKGLAAIAGDSSARKTSSPL